MSGLQLTHWWNASETPIAMDRIDHVHPHGIMVAFADGHVQSVSPGATYAATVWLLSRGRTPEAVLRNAEALDRAE